MQEKNKLILRQYFTKDEIETFNDFKIYALINIINLIELEKKLNLIDSILITQIKPENIEKYISDIYYKIDEITFHYNEKIREDVYNEYVENIDKEYENFKNNLRRIK